MRVVATLEEERLTSSHMAKHKPTLSSALERLGLARDTQVELYGITFELISAPIIVGNLAFVDGIEISSGKLRRVRVPEAIVVRARQIIGSMQSYSSMAMQRNHQNRER